MTVKTGGHLTLETALICDDIRKEFNGKDIIIGVYGGDDILVPNIPVNLSLSVYTRFRAVEADNSVSHKLEFRVHGRTRSSTRWAGEG